MGMFLNNGDAYENYKEVVSDTYFVDKSELIAELLPAIGRSNKYFCFTRPRRFGKSVMANMVAAYFSKANDSHDIFDHLDIAGSAAYRDHLNQHDVIYIDFSQVPENCSNYRQYIDRILKGLEHDILDAFGHAAFHGVKGVRDMLSKTGHKFIFILDEWDAVFHMDFMTQQDRSGYLLLLKNLLKDKAYVELAYMTGVLPIAKYSSGSELNMFMEYSMISKIRFGQYFGFTDHEVDQLYAAYRRNTEKASFTREDLRIWYDGYYNAAEERLYNPRSIVSALLNNELSNYWTSSGPYDEVFYYIKDNIDHVQDDIALMISGKGVSARVQEYAATSRELKTKDQIYSAMIVYGLLTYFHGEVLIPNKELMDKFDEFLIENNAMGYVHQLAKRSKSMLQATLTGDTATMAAIMEFAHNTESPILQYNSEVELAAVVNLVYLAARDEYRVVREDPAGKGFADFIFYPYRADRDCIIVELKVDASPDAAIAQIRRKEYALNFTQSGKYTGRILLVGIGYDRKTKTHSCKVEELEDV